MKEKVYLKDREDRIYEGICKAERAFALTTIVLDFGFDDPKLTAEQISTLQARNGEIGQIIFSIRDYLIEIQELLETLQYEEPTAPKVENSDLNTEKYDKYDIDRKYYKREINKMIDAIDNIEWLIKLYTFIKGFYDDVEGRAIK
jgi:hypothetical protein